MLTRPHRVAFLAPTIGLSSEDHALAVPLVRLLSGLVTDHLLRHDRVALGEVELFGQSAVLDSKHERFAEVKARAFTAARRDETLWLELDLTRPGAGTVHLKTERSDGAHESFSAIGAGSLSALVGQCLRQWLETRGLDASPRGPLPEFAIAELFAAARWLGAQAGADAIGDPNDVPAPLRATTLRAAGADRQLGTVFARVLALEPHDPRALFSRYQAERHEPPQLDALRAIIAAAPRWWEPYAVLAGTASLPLAERIDAFAAATELRPDHDDLLDSYSDALKEQGRSEEAFRFADRASRLAPWDAGHHVRAIEHGTDSGRMGQKLADAARRIAALEQLGDEGGLNLGNPDVVHARLRYDASLMYVGRLDEAITLRDQLIGGEGAWPAQNKVLALWRESRSMLAHSYALEAHHRGDPGRVIEGYALARPDSGIDMFAFIEALVAAGEDEQSALAFAHVHLQKFGRGPQVRLAGAKALMAAGLFAEALEQLEAVVFGQPQRRLETEIERVLRLGATVAPEKWEEQIQRRVDRGARRLAARLARDAADFVPGLTSSAVVRAALGDSPATAFDPRWLGELASLVAVADRKTVDALFEGSTASLEDADRLSASWPATLPKNAAARAYLFAQALARYFARTTERSGGPCSGLRHAATGALESLWHVEVPIEVARAALAAIEAASGCVDDWMLDAWLLRFERATGLEDRTAGRLGALAAGLPRVQTLLRGDETVGAELRAARALAARDDAASAAQARVRFERCARAVGYYEMVPWVEATERSVPTAELVDVAWVAAVANPWNGVPGLTLGKAYFADGKADLALEVLSRFLGGAGMAWRDKRVAELTPTWAAAQLDVPIDFDGAQSAGFAALQAGNWALADRCYRWCLARDPGNAQCRKNLGIASARLGRTFETVLAFAAADYGKGPLWAGSELLASKKPAEAKSALRYASLFFTAVPEWLQLAMAAWYTGDEETKADAIGHALELDPSAVAPAFLNGYAAALQELGELDRCETASKRLLELAGADPTFKSCALHNLACVALARGDAKAALSLAREAAALNPLDANKTTFADTVARAERNDPHPIAPRSSQTAAARAFRTLLDGDAKAATELAASAADGRLARAQIAAARYRFASDNDVVVTARALATARSLLAATGGTTDRDFALARIAALRVVEDAIYPVDPPALLGARLTTSSFREQLAARESD